MTSVCRQPTPTSGWVLISYPDPGIRLLILIDGPIWRCQTKRFVIFFCDHDRWTTLRRIISARILYQHSIGLGALSPKVNWKCFVKMYIITNPARFHSNPSHEAFGKDDQNAQARTYLAMTKTSVPMKSELLIDKHGRQWAHNNVQNGPRLLIYFFVNSWKRNFSFFLKFQHKHTASFLNAVSCELLYRWLSFW